MLGFGFWHGISLLDKGHKLNPHKKFRRRLGCFLNVLCKFHRLLTQLPKIVSKKYTTTLSVFLPIQLFLFLTQQLICQGILTRFLKNGYSYGGKDFLKDICNLYKYCGKGTYTACPASWWNFIFSLYPSIIASYALPNLVKIYKKPKNIHIYYLSIYLYIYLSIYLSTYLSIDPSIHPSIHPSIYMQICKYTHR